MLNSFWGLAQPALPDTNLLDRDPVFRSILSRRLNYPILNAQKGHTKLVYAQFDIDDKGHVQNAKILNPAKGGYYFVDFDAAVVKTIKRLPPLNPLYSGKYILPVIFALKDLGTGTQVVPDNTNFNGKLDGIILLRSVTISSYTDRYSHAPKTSDMPGKEMFNSTLKLK